MAASCSLLSELRDSADAAKVTAKGPFEFTISADAPYIPTDEQRRRVCNAVLRESSDSATVAANGSASEFDYTDQSPWDYNCCPPTRTQVPPPVAAAPPPPPAHAVVHELRDGMVRLRRRADLGPWTSDLGECGDSNCGCYRLRRPASRRRFRELVVQRTLAGTIAASTRVRGQLAEHQLERPLTLLPRAHQKVVDAHDIEPLGHSVASPQ